MLIVKLVVAVLIVAGTLILLFRLQRYFRGDSPIPSARGRSESSRASADELESFIAAYRQNKDAAPPAEPPPELTSWAARKSFLTPHLKLCYMVLKAGLPDHHVFCSARLMDALELHAGHPLAQARIDIVVCNKDLAPVVAIDVCNADERDTPVEREKSERLRSAGIRHLRFTPGGIPKPAEIRDLIYRS
jgi:hypothetical protein